MLYATSLTPAYASQPFTSYSNRASLQMPEEILSSVRGAREGPTSCDHESGLMRLDSTQRKNDAGVGTVRSSAETAGIAGVQFTRSADSSKKKSRDVRASLR